MTESGAKLSKAIELSRAGRAQEALDAFSEIIENDREQRHIVLGHRAWQYRQLGQYEAALRINPNLAGAHYNLGDALSELPGRLPDAIAQYEAALRINPDLAEAHYNLGNALSEMPGRSRDAIAHYEAALRIRPDPELSQTLNRLRAGYRTQGR